MTYQIADEPVDSALRDYVVRPSIPLLAIMVAGAWMSWPWFAFNAIAMGSPTRRKEIGLCAAAFAGTAVLAVLLLELVDLGVIQPEGLSLRLAILAIVAFKLTMTYYISVVQERTFHVYQYYGGSVRNASIVLSIAYYIRPLILGISDDPLWIIIVAGGI